MLSNNSKLSKDQLRDGILYYRRKKTARISSDEADIQIKILPVAKIILDKYASQDDFLFHFEKTHYVRNCVQYILLYTFYSNRHTMASMARNICGVDYMTVHQMLNHAAPSQFRTTDVYLARDFRPLWEANEKLYNLFDWSFYLNQAKK